MSVDRLPSGRFRARLMIDGVRYVETFPTREDAESWEIVTRARVITGTLPTATTVAEYAPRWLSGYDTAPYNTRSFHRANVGHVLAALGGSRIARVTPTDVTRMLNGIAARHSPALAERVYRTASAMFASAAADGLCPAGSPVRSKKHRPRRQREHPEVLEREQARAVLEELDGWHRDTALVQLALGTRFGEIAGLTPYDVDLKRGLIHIRRRYSAHAKTIRATKNHRQRSLEVPQLLRSTLQRLIGEAGDPPRLPGLADREIDARPFARHWLIQTRTGRPPQLTAFNRALGAACENVGAPRVSSHGLRHTYVSWMIDEGHSADKIAFWIGDMPQTVRLVYAHMLEASSASAAAAMDAALGGFDEG
jgi:integrase